MFTDSYSFYIFCNKATILGALILTSMLFSSKFVRSWNLTPHNISSDYYVSSAAVFINRAFLTLPRSNCYNYVWYPTLIQVPWTGYELPQVMVMTSINYPSNVGQQWGNCMEMQNAVSVEVEQTSKARLWVLDTGNSHCEAKLVIYNVFLNIEVGRASLPYKGLSYVTVDKASAKVKAYIGGIENLLIIYDTDTNEWSKVYLKSADDVKIPTRYLALSRVQDVLYMTTAKKRDLFSIDVKSFRNNTNEALLNCTNVTAQHIGEKLGPSEGLIADLRGGLNYYLSYDYAIVRWNTKEPLIAEHHYVLAQSYNVLRNVPHMFTDSFENVWSLISPPENCQLSNELIDLPARCVKILKYNKNGANNATLTLVNHTR